MALTSPAVADAPRVGHWEKHLNGRGLTCLWNVCGLSSRGLAAGYGTEWRDSKDGNGGRLSAIPRLLGYAVPSESSSIYRFGLFEVDPRAGELRKNGVKLKLQEQPYQLLLKLLERPGEIVSREDLRSA